LLAEKYQAEIDQILKKYPPEQKRAAVLPLLYLAQREIGAITQAAVAEIAQLLDLNETQVGGLIGFYTLLHDKPEAKIRVQICTDLPCALRGADEFTEKICENLGIRIGETTEDGFVTVEEVMCLAACDRAPMFQVQEPDGIHYHENQTVETALEVIEEYRKRESNA
jgi:NADH-quinone oxidoreductase subunit E